MERKLTEPQERALRVLERAEEQPSGALSPAMLGEMMVREADYNRINKAQGMGRLGGTMGTRLIRIGLAYRKETRNQYTGEVYDHGYAITGKGRVALRNGTY